MLSWWTKLGEFHQVYSRGSLKADALYKNIQKFNPGYGELCVFAMKLLFTIIAVTVIEEEH